MRRVFGDRKRINLGSSMFRRFIETDCLYVDKTRFIEHVLDEASEVLLFTRPRRTGKSLNLDMLRTFLDCKQDSRAFFEGLYIEGSPAFAQLNKHPVLLLDFKELRTRDFFALLRRMLRRSAAYYLQPDQMDFDLGRYLVEDERKDTGGLRLLIENIHAVYGIRPIVLIDEYDKVLTDSVGTPEYEDIRKWITEVFESAFKGNASLEKAIITGITRVSQESMFSGLNNPEIIDVFTPSAYDGDFSLTEEEAVELLDEGQLAIAREWYNNYRVGNEKLYTMYSVMSYLKSGQLRNYWGKSGTMDLLGRFLNTKRMENLVDLFSPGAKLTTALEQRLSYQMLLQNSSDKMYYSLAVQAGYLSHELLSQTGTDEMYQVYIHNEELRSVWRSFILDDTVQDPDNRIRDVFASIGNTEEFSKRLVDYISFRLSYFDLKAELEWVYHVLTLGLMLGAGFKCTSNKESGYGRYDLLVEGEGFVAILEFKTAKTQRGLVKEAKDALAQIDDQKYFAILDRRDATAAPIYKVGIACYKTSCHVETVLHDG